MCIFETRRTKRNFILQDDDMQQDKDELKKMLEQLEAISSRQKDVSAEITALRVRLDALLRETSAQGQGEKKNEIAQASAKKPLETSPVPNAIPLSKTEDSSSTSSDTSSNQDTAPQKTQNSASKALENHKASAQRKENQKAARLQETTKWERIIGGNILNKIGILLAIFGVAIGVKYSIENNLISPITRIILGYCAGLTVLLLSVKLKKKYLNYSAVLLSGATTILYFVTFSAYNFYELIPQVPAFIGMVIITLFTVAAALHYQKQVIALLGLVGSYAVPFLLSDGSGRVEVMLTYMCIINAGVLALALKKSWNLVYVSATILSWIIFSAWWVTDYNNDQIHMALGFGLIFFLTFYIVSIGFKLKSGTKLSVFNVMMVLFNAFLFFGIGYDVLDLHPKGEDYLGLFTLCNALLHFGMSLFVFKKGKGDKSILYMVAGLMLVFATITIPVQLDGNWVTLIWSVQAALFFWIGRRKSISIYENISYPLMVLAFFSLIHDWLNTYALGIGDQHPFWNMTFFTSLCFASTMGFILYTRNKTQDNDAVPSKNVFLLLLRFLAPALLLLSLFWGIHLEIDLLFEQLYQGSEIRRFVDQDQYESTFYNKDYRFFGVICKVLHAMIFVSLLSWVNLKRIQNQILGGVNLVLNLMVTFIYLMVGLFVLSELRENYLGQANSAYFEHGFMNLGIRYLSYLVLVGLIFSIYAHLRSAFMRMSSRFTPIFVCFVFGVILWVMASELLHILDLSGVENAYKFSISILFGAYGLLMIGIGIWKSKQYLRIAGMVLFAITLIKLIFYDLGELSTLAKTAVFLCLGASLLLSSFLYNKYQSKIDGSLDE